MMDRKMVNFIKEQYPPGTRIRLNSMDDPHHPILPGTEGEVDFVDDEGQIFMKWDNGRTLPLAPGEDSFTVLPPKLTSLKLYMPLTADLYERNEYGDFDDSSTLLEGSELRGYQDQITAALVKNRMPEETERGLMHWYDEADSVDRKVRSAVFTVEKRDRQLWGVAECRVAGELSDTELETLKEYLTGQASDGWGEGFEQREISVDDGGKLYVHLWNSDEWSIQTEQELFSPKLAEGLPELCFSTLASTGELICIKRGESGYYPSDWNTNDPAQNQELADYNNERLGVTQEQRLAMECGSMHGWGVPGADPGYYEQKMGGMKFGYNNMAIGMYAGNSGNALYCPTGYLELLCLQDRFVYLPEMPYRKVDLDKAARNVLTQEQFEQDGGDGTVASWRNTVTVENVHPNTTVSFRMNNLSGDTAGLKLYAYGADRKLAEVGKELWSITDETGAAVDTLSDGTLYELRVSVADGSAFDLSEAEREIKISVVLAK